MTTFVAIDFRPGMWSAGGSSSTVAPPTRAELRIAAAALPSDPGPCGPFTKSQRLEARRVFAALGRKAGKTVSDNDERKDEGGATRKAGA